MVQLNGKKQKKYETFIFFKSLTTFIGVKQIFEKTTPGWYSPEKFIQIFNTILNN